MSLPNDIKCRGYIKINQNPETAAVGKTWTVEEETQLINLLSLDKDIEDIAKEHKRMPGGIKARMKLIAVRMIDSGKSVDEVCSKLRMTQEDIEEAQQQFKNKKPKSTLTSNVKSETVLDVLKDIRKLLIQIERKL